jgi:hypothetical protein
VKLFKPLLGLHEVAKGIVYTEPIQTGWRPPRFLERLSEEDRDFVRKKYNIIVEGNEKTLSLLKRNGEGGMKCEEKRRDEMRRAEKRRKGKRREEKREWKKQMGREERREEKRRREKREEERRRESKKQTRREKRRAEKRRKKRAQKK